MAITNNDIKSIISQSKVEVTIDLGKELKGVPSFHKAEISSEVADLIRKEVGNDAVNSAISSVSGKKFKGLSKEYKALKQKAGKGGKANLVLDGKMLGALKKASTTQTAKLLITKDIEKKKFYNHNVGDTLPQRQALPNEGEAFRAGIMKKINKLVKSRRKEVLDEIKGK